MRRSSRWRYAAAGLALGLPGGAAAEQRTVIEALIAAQNPCAGLVTEQFGQRIGVEELEDVTLPEADLSLRGDDITARFRGTLSCRAPAGAILQGNASAAIAADAALSLSDCSVETLSVRLSDFSGTFGPALRTFGPQLEQSLAEQARAALEAGCRDFRGRR